MDGHVFLRRWIGRRLRGGNDSERHAAGPTESGHRRIAQVVHCSQEGRLSVAADELVAGIAQQSTQALSARSWSGAAGVIVIVRQVLAGSSSAPADSASPALEFVNLLILARFHAVDPDGHRVVTLFLLPRQEDAGMRSAPTRSRAPMGSGPRKPGTLVLRQFQAVNTLMLARPAPHGMTLGASVQVREGGDSDGWTAPTSRASDGPRRCGAGCTACHC